MNGVQIVFQALQKIRCNIWLFGSEPIQLNSKVSKYAGVHLCLSIIV